MTVEEMAKRLRYEKDRMGYCNRQLSRMSGVAGATIRGMTVGEGMAAIDRFNAVAAIFGLTLKLVPMGDREEKIHASEVKAEDTLSEQLKGALAIQQGRVLSEILRRAHVCYDSYRSLSSGKVPTYMRRYDTLLRQNGYRLSVKKIANW